MRGTKRQKDSSASYPTAQPLPEDYICIDEEETALVFDCLDGGGSAEERAVADMHLKLCLHCQEAAAALIKLRSKIEARAPHCLHPDTGVETDKVETAAKEDEVQRAAEEDAEIEENVASDKRKIDNKEIEPNISPVWIEPPMTTFHLLARLSEATQTLLSVFLPSLSCQQTGEVSGCPLISTHQSSVEAQN
jgi:hypothetical protein